MRHDWLSWGASTERIGYTTKGSSQPETTNPYSGPVASSLLLPTNSFSPALLPRLPAPESLPPENSPCLLPSAHPPQNRPHPHQRRFLRSEIAGVSPGTLTDAAGDDNMTPGGASGYRPESSVLPRVSAEVAELADALHSGCSARQGVEVRVLSSAPIVFRPLYLQ
jgi:hypothetical protein